MNLIPNSVIQKRWYEALSKLEYGTLTFVTPEGDVRVFKGRQAGPEARFEIGAWDVLSQIAARGDIALGEQFIDGAWRTDNIETLISLFLVNLDHFDGFAHGNLVNRIGFVLLNSLMRRNSEKGSKRNIEAHYDVGNEFYSLWLDDTMTYSSALYKERDISLEDAQRQKYGRILSRFTKPKSSVLEIGCGWGGFAEQAAANDHELTGLTVSPAQHAFATNRLGSKADIRLQDYRRTKGAFDMIVSIEMFEAVGEHYWPQYFQVLSERLAKGGRAVIQTITIRDELFAGYRTRSDFIRHYVFPGGTLPSLSRFREEAARAGLACVDTFSFGQDYAKTLRQWTNRLTAQQGAIKAQGHDDAFIRNWQFYLGMCASAFAVGRSDVVQVELAQA